MCVGGGAVVFIWLYLCNGDVSRGDGDGGGGCSDGGRGDGAGGRGDGAGGVDCFVDVVCFVVWCCWWSCVDVVVLMFR